MGVPGMVSEKRRFGHTLARVGCISTKKPLPLTLNFVDRVVSFFSVLFSSFLFPFFSVVFLSSFFVLVDLAFCFLSVDSRAGSAEVSSLRFPLSRSIESMCFFHLLSFLLCSFSLLFFDEPATDPPLFMGQGVLFNGKGEREAGEEEGGEGAGSKGRSPLEPLGAPWTSLVP
jgi:hypothetical protein